MSEGEGVVSERERERDLHGFVAFFQYLYLPQFESDFIISLYEL